MENVKFAIDLSKWNGKVDFAGVKANTPKVDLVILKASEGSGTEDKQFVRNASECVMNGIPWGAYHFATWNSQDVSRDATNEAYFFIKTVRKIGKPAIMVLDVETNDTRLPITKQQLESYCSIFLSILEREKYEVAIYMSPGFSWFLPKVHKLGKYRLWVADYSGKINTVNGWQKPWLHQYTDQGTCAGVPTKCDLNKSV